MIRMFQSRVLRKTFKPKQEQMEMHNEVHDTYSSSDIIRVTTSKIA
jgi:hypothetical protein